MNEACQVWIPYARKKTYGPDPDLLYPHIERGFEKCDVDAYGVRIRCSPWEKIGVTREPLPGAVKGPVTLAEAILKGDVEQALPPWHGDGF